MTLIRFFDIFISFVTLIVLSPLLLIILIISWFDTGQPIFSQLRMGKYKNSFLLYKFRSMSIDTLSMSSHLVPKSQISIIGRFLRKYKFDELLQLYNVLRGDMSLVGPRPNLLNQNDVCIERDIRGIYSHKPGITGFSQLQMIDMSRPKLLAETDAFMMSNLNLNVYFRCIFKTLAGKGFGDSI